MYCKNCGSKLPENSVFCSECGTKQNSDNNEEKDTVEIRVQEEGTPIGWGFLGFFVPIAGLILFLVWKLNKPKAAKAAGIGALISVILSIVFYIILFVILIAVGASSSYTGSSSIYY